MRDRAADRRLMRYLHGELPAKDVRELRAELAKDPALQARLAELHRLWQGLQPSPPTPAPFGYLPKIQRLAEAKRTTAATRVVGWGMTPPWVGALAAAALVAGVVLGVGLGRMPQKAQATVAEQTSAAALAASSPASTTEGVGASVPAPSAVASSEPAARPLASAPLPSSTRAPETAVPARRESSSTPSATDLADAIAGDDTASLGGNGGSTLAEEYWQALEGFDGERDGGGGQGDAGW